LPELRAAVSASGAVGERSSKILCPDPLTLSLHGRMWLRTRRGEYPPPAQTGVRGCSSLRPS
jgi:hypothetical protein